MTRPSLAIAIATILAGSAALAQQPATNPDVAGTPPSTPHTDYRTTSPVTTDHTAADTTNHPDEKFLKEFAHANAAEVEVGKLAADKAQNADVKAFAKHMVDDHSKTISKVESIASKTNVDVKAKPDLMHKAKSELLEMKSGTNFDRAYMKAMVDDHTKVVEMLQKEIRDGRDASVKELASKALPEVQKHLKMAQDLHAKVSNEKYSSTSTPNNTTATDKSSTNH
jgi:putative membrane protein